MCSQDLLLLFLMHLCCVSNKHSYARKLCGLSQALRVLQNMLVKENNQLVSLLMLL